MAGQKRSANKTASKTAEKGTLATLVDKATDAVGSILPSGRTDALDLLKEDHERVQKLFDEVKSSDEKRHPALFERIKKELDVHAHIEEAIFYPNLKAQGDKELVDIVLEGIEEHRQVKMFLKEIDALIDDSSKFEPKLKVLIEDVEHHVSEEEDTMFPLVRDQFSSEVLEDLAAEMEKEKRKFKKSLSASAGK
jgi:iron-sulfur cluster repair protein YtfE (RIC family)